MMGRGLSLCRRRMRGSGSILAFSGMSYWVAGTETDSQNLTNLGSSGAGTAQFGSTSGADSNDPSSLPWYATTDYDVTVDGVNYKYLSDNLVTNGTFEDSTGWTLGIGWSVSSGTLNNNGGGATAQASTGIACSASKKYHVTFETSNRTTGTLHVRWNGGVQKYSTTTNGSHSFVTTPDATNASLIFLDVSSWDGSIDNVVVREVTANLGDYVYLPGTSGNYLSHPDSAAVSVTGDITIQVECALDDWDTADQTLISKYGDSSQSFLIRNNTSKTILILLRSGGVNQEFASSTGHSFSDGEKGIFRITYNTSTTTAKVYTSSDGESFAQLGTDITSFTHTSIDDGTSLVGLGARGTAFTSSLANGSFYSAHIWDSDIGDTATSSAATPVMHWEASSMTQSGGADEESGSSWTINRSSSGLKSTLVTRPVIVFNSAASTYLTVADHDDLDMGASDDFTVWVYGRRQGEPGYFAQFINKKGNASSDPGYGVRVSGSSENLNTWMYGGAETNLTSDSVVTDQTSIILAMARDVTADELLNYDGSNSKTTTDLSTATLANAVALRIGTNISAFGNADFELFAAGVLKGTSLSSDQLASLKTELDTLLGGRIGE